jgi:hypothetical protein
MLTGYIGVHSHSYIGDYTEQWRLSSYGLSGRRITMNDSCSVVDVDDSQTAISGQTGRRHLIRPQYLNEFTINMSDQSKTSVVTFCAINALMNDRCTLNGHDQAKWWEKFKDTWDL